MPATVTVEQLQKNTHKVVARARKRPLHVKDENGGTVVMLAIEKYEQELGVPLRELLRERMKEEPAYTNDEVNAMLRDRLRQRRRRV
jgi:PHD/YefM family antitoxin component YafN of YafNO toxin-antitoxin module